MTIDELLDEQGINDTCYSCKYLTQWVEYHKYGESCATEHLFECTAPKDELCPRLEK